METDLINHFNLRFVCVFSINGKYFGHLELEIVWAIAQGERAKFDRFVDPNVRDAKRRVYPDLRI